MCNEVGCETLYCYFLTIWMNVLGKVKPLETGGAIGTWASREEQYVVIAQMITAEMLDRKVCT